jgi:hypothetical protein
VLSDSFSAAAYIAKGEEWSRQFTWERCAREALRVYRRVAARAF